MLITTNWTFGISSVIPQKENISNKTENITAKQNATVPKKESANLSEKQIIYGYPQNWGFSYVPVVQYVPQVSQVPQQRYVPKVHTSGPKSEFELVDTRGAGK